MTLKKNLPFSLLLTLVNMGFPAVILWFGARELGPVNFGKYLIAYSLASGFLLAGSLGIPLYGIRVIARNRNIYAKKKHVFSQIMTLNGAATLVAFLIYLTIILVTPSFRESFPIFLIFSFLVLGNIGTTDFLFQGQEQYGVLAIRSSLPKLALLATIPFLIYMPEHGLRLGLIVVASIWIPNIIGMVQSWNEFNWVPFRLALREHTRPLAWITASILIATLYMQLDIFLLGMATTLEEVSYYSTISRLLRAFTVFFASMGTLVLTKNSHHFADSKPENADRLTEFSLEFAFLFGFPLVLILLFNASEIIIFIFGNQYASAANGLRCMACILVLAPINHILGIQRLYPEGGERILFYSGLASTLTGISMIFLLAPYLGHVGASCAGVLAELATMSLIIYKSKSSRSVLISSLKRFPLIILISGIIFPTLIFISKYFESSHFFAAPWIYFLFPAIGLLPYLTLLWLFRSPFIREYGRLFLPRLLH